MAVGGVPNGVRNGVTGGGAATQRPATSATGTVAGGAVALSSTPPMTAADRLRDVAVSSIGAEGLVGDFEAKDLSDFILQHADHDESGSINNPFESLDSGLGDLIDHLNVTNNTTEVTGEALTKAIAAYDQDKSGALSGAELVRLLDNFESESYPIMLPPFGEIYPTPPTIPHFPIPLPGEVWPPMPVPPYPDGHLPMPPNGPGDSVPPVGRPPIGRPDGPGSSVPPIGGPSIGLPPLEAPSRPQRPDAPHPFEPTVRPQRPDGDEPTSETGPRPD